MDHSAVMLLIHPESGKIIESNNAAANFYGYPAKQLESMNIYDLNTMSREAIADEMAAATKETRNHFFFQHRLANGTVRAVEVHSSPVETDQGKVLFSVIHDITRRIEAENARRESDSRFNMMLDNVSVGISILDRNGIVTECNKYLESILGASAAKIIGTNVPATVVNEGQKEALQKFLSGKMSAWEGDYTSVVGGKTLAIRSLYLPYVDANGVPAGGLCLTENLDETKKIEAKIQAERQFSRGIIANMQDGFSLVDATGKQTEVNRAFCEMTGFSRSELIGAQAPNFLYWPPEELPRIHEAFNKAIAGSTESFELTFMRKNGERFQTIVSPSPIYDHEGTLISYVASVKDITERKRAEERIHNLAFYDPLTQLPNRRLFVEHLKQSSHTHARRGNHGAILFIDVDHFKKINDTEGHAMGDAVLSEMALRMQRGVHVDDTVARWSGDEFVILLNDLNQDMIQAGLESEVQAEKLRNLLSEPYLVEGKILNNSVSIGICLFGSDEVLVEEVLKRADIAMYQAKNSGRNSIHFYDSAMHAAMSARIALETDLRQAIPGDELSLYYQAQVDENGKVVGAEALIRWRHPRQGLILPGRFIGIAEETNLIRPLGKWILTSACKQVQLWQRLGKISNLKISINVSTTEFGQPDFVDGILSVIQQMGLNGNSLKIELTESVAFTDIELTLSKMERLKQAGLSFSIDDFGTGFSSLAYLSQLPFDQLKIDQSFIKNLQIKPNDALIVQTIIGMAKNLDMQVIAEGVETQAQYDFLKDHGCTCFQGFLFSKPIPAEEFETLLQAGSTP